MYGMLQKNFGKSCDVPEAKLAFPNQNNQNTFDTINTSVVIRMLIFTIDIMTMGQTVCSFP